MKNILMAISFFVFVLGACGAQPTPAIEQTILPASVNTSPISGRIVYYYFVATTENPRPKGSVVIMADTYILAPTTTDLIYGPDTVANLRVALEAVLGDGRNGWTSSNLEIIDVTFGDGHANLVLQGEYFGVGDITLIAAKMQILMSVFANASVHTATITLNGETIGNMGISNSINTKPADYVFTRAEVETFISEHSYIPPSLPYTPTSLPQTSSPSTYTNFKYGYSLNYPDSYSVVAVSDEYVEIGDKIVISVWSVDPTTPRGDDPVIESTSDIQVSGYPAKLLTGYIGAVGGYVPQQYRKIIVEREGLYFIFTLYAFGLHATEGDVSQIAQLVPEDVSIFNAMATTLQIP